jgi:Stress responsive A/B Barrel Domain
MKNLIKLSILMTSLNADVSHVVFCWLKEPNSIDAKNKLIEATKSLKQVEEVESIAIGHKISSQRKIVDSSYDLAITFRFKNKENLEKYLQHPLHKDATTKTLIPLTSKVVIYDFDEERVK